MADFSRRNCGFGWRRHLHGICRGSVRRRLAYGTGRARAAWRGLWSDDDRRRPWPYAALSHPRFFRRDHSLCMRGRGGTRHHLLYPPSIHGYAIPCSRVSSRGRGRFGVHRGHRDRQLIANAPLGIGSWPGRRSEVMARQAQTFDSNVELADIPGASLRVSRIAIGTWAIGGWMWGGTDEAESICTIRAALEHGINVVDTAPIYGFGRSEEIVGKAIAEGGQRSRVLIATKVGLEWRDGEIFRNSSRDRINHEIEQSLQRLRTDHLDIYQVHW